MSEKYEQDANQLGNTLRELREENGLTREQLSERSEIGLRHLAAIELGEKNPSVKTLIRLVHSMGATPNRVFYPEQYAQNSDLDRISRLSATCSSSQQKLIIGFIELLLKQKNTD